MTVNMITRAAKNVLTWVLAQLWEYPCIGAWESLRVLFEVAKRTENPVPGSATGQGSSDKSLDHGTQFNLPIRTINCILVA